MCVYHLCLSVKSSLNNAEMLLYVRLVRREPRDFTEASLGALEVSLLHIDHTQVVPRLDVPRLHLQDPAETRLGGRQVAVVVDVDVAKQNESFAVVRMMLKPQPSVAYSHSMEQTTCHC